MNIKEVVGNNLQHMRKDVLKMTQQEFADAFGCGVKTCRRMEQGVANITVYDLYYLYIKFGITLGDLFPLEMIRGKDHIDEIIDILEETKGRLEKLK